MGEQTRTAPIVHLYAPSLPRTSEKAVMYAVELVESGLSRKLLDDPGHPCTRALTRAFPAIGDPVTRMAPAGLPGDPPNPAALGRGRPFAARCPTCTTSRRPPLRRRGRRPAAGRLRQHPCPAVGRPAPGDSRRACGCCPVFRTSPRPRTCPHRPRKEPAHIRLHHRHGRRTHRGHAARAGVASRTSKPPTRGGAAR
ncbi:oligopeptide/dipeptide ABC transporter ATP-binding protein [Streptomyces sp. NPDC046870]|uniref:oligopeptide/dipeptide ABC transporter ATP-binding protein n=1 Tax=Streptomyces sp. NPDC046870 TaxID=3155135 RepID=UPI003456D765